MTQEHEPLPPHLENVLKFIRKELCNWLASDQQRTCSRCEQRIPSLPSSITWELKWAKGPHGKEGYVPSIMVSGTHPFGEIIGFGISLDIRPSGPSLTKYDRREGHEYPLLCETCTRALVKVLHVEGLRFQKGDPTP